MSLKVRLWMQGCKNRRCFRVVVADSRSPRSGKYVESIGWYNPRARDEQYSIQEERLKHWLSVGAQVSPTVGDIVKKAAPELMKEHAMQLQARQGKARAKRRERNKK